MKRSQQSVPAAETGAIPGDFSGSRGVTLPQGSRNTSVGEHARGGALAKPGRSVPTGPNQGSMPLRKPPAGLASVKIGQTLPQTGAVSTKKPNRKGGAAFYGEL